MEFEKSTHRKRWVRREPEGIVGHQSRPAEDEPKRGLIIRSCIQKVFRIGKKMNLARYVTLTAMAYVRRYFEVENVRGSDFTLTIISAIYLAGKVEEMTPTGTMGLDQRGVDMDALCKLVETKTRSARELKQLAIRNEMKILVALDFDLICFHPLRPAVGFLNELAKSLPAMLPSDKMPVLNDLLWMKCSGLYLVGDLMFSYPPAFLGAIATYCTIRSSALTERASLLEALIQVISESIPLEDKRLIFERRLKEAVDILDEGLLKERSTEADAAYDEFFKRNK